MDRVYSNLKKRLLITRFERGSTKEVFKSICLDNLGSPAYDYLPAHVIHVLVALRTKS